MSHEKPNDAPTHGTTLPEIEADGYVVAVEDAPDTDKPPDGGYGVSRFPLERVTP